MEQVENRGRMLKPIRMATSKTLDAVLVIFK
jgi:hypothetical protein